jgi:hypothetical protein
MSLTLSNWIVIFFVAVLLGMLMTFIIYVMEGKRKSIMIACGVMVLYFIVAISSVNWYNTNTASGIRDYKDFQSELSNGMEREINITAEDGRQIFYYEGKFDVELNHEDNYIKFESEDGKRYIIYYGIQDTITIIEK